MLTSSHFWKLFIGTEVPLPSSEKNAKEHDVSTLRSSQHLSLGQGKQLSNSLLFWVPSVGILVLGSSALELAGFLS